MLYSDYNAACLSCNMMCILYITPRATLQYHELISHTTHTRHLCALLKPPFFRGLYCDNQL